MCMTRPLVTALLISLAVPAAVLADEPIAIELTLKDHKFSPGELRAPAGKALAIKLTNLDATPEEFDSTALKIEKIVTPNGSIVIKVRPLAAGTYPFKGEYNEGTAQGVLVIE